LKEMKL